MLKIDEKTILNYIEIKNNLPLLIKNSGLRQNFIFDKIGMSRSTWTKKLRDGNFTEKEILAIAKIVN